MADEPAGAPKLDRLWRSWLWQRVILYRRRSHCNFPRIFSERNATCLGAAEPRTIGRESSCAQRSRHAEGLGPINPQQARAAQHYARRQTVGVVVLGRCQVGALVKDARRDRHRTSLWRSRQESRDAAAASHDTGDIVAAMPPQECRLDWSGGSRDRTKSPAAVSAKRDYSRIGPETSRIFGAAE